MINTAGALVKPHTREIIMQINPIAPNQTEVTLNDGTVILFSYKTPVAAFLPDADQDDGAFIRTRQKWSVTTSKHINAWLNGTMAVSVPQSKLDKLGN